MISASVDAKQLLVHLKSIANNSDVAIDSCVDELASVALSNAKQSKAYVTRSPSNGLRANTILENTTQMLRTIKMNKSYGGYIEFGNDPGTGRIYPVKAKALRFVIDGQVFFRKSVKASKPRLVFTSAREVSTGIGIHIINGRLTRLFREGR